MSSATSINALYRGLATKHALGTRESIQVQDQLARTMYGVPLNALSPMQRNSIEMSSMTIMSSGGSGMLGVSDGGMVYGDIYKGIVSSAAGVMTGGGVSFGHSPQAMSAASSVMQNLNAAVHGSGAYGVGTGGSLKTMGGVMRQRLMREGLGEGSTEVISRRGKDGKTKSLGAMVDETSSHKGMSDSEKKAIVGQELSGAMLTGYIDRLKDLTAEERQELKIADVDLSESLDAMDATSRRRVKEAIAKQAAKDKASGKYKKVQNKIIKEQADAYREELKKDTSLSEAERESRVESFTNKLEAAGSNIDLSNKANIESAARAAKGENEYTTLTESAAKEQRDAMRRAASLTKEMSEVFGTDDADQLLSIAKQFGSKTLDAEKDVRNMKRIMDVARTRAAATGRTLSDVMGEMQGIAAVGAQAVGSHGVTAGYLEHATKQMQASQATRNAGMDYRTDEEVQAEIAEQEQNMQRNMNEGLYALEMMKNGSPEEREQYAKWAAKLQSGQMTPEEVEQFRQMGSAYVAKNTWKLDPRKMQEIAQQSSLAETARTAMAGGVMQDHIKGNVADLMATATMYGPDTQLARAVSGSFGSTDEASSHISNVLAMYGGQQKELSDDFKSIKRLKGEEREKWIQNKKEQLIKSGMSSEQADKAEEAYRSLAMMADSGENGAFLLDQIHNIQGSEQVRNSVGAIENTKAAARMRQTQREESIKRSQEASATKGMMIGGLNYSNATDEAKALGLLHAADRSIARQGGSIDLIDNKTGELNIENINRTDLTGRGGVDNAMTEYIANNAIAFKVGKDGLVNMDQAKATIRELEADGSEAAKKKLANLRRALNLSEGQDVSTAIAGMDATSLTNAIFSAHQSGTSAVVHTKEGLMVAGSNEEMDEAAKTAQKQNALMAMAKVGIGQTELITAGKALLNGEENTRAGKDALETAYGMMEGDGTGTDGASFMAVMESMGVKGGIIEKDGKKAVVDKNGIEHDMSDPLAVANTMAKALDADPNLQTTFRERAEAGDAVAAAALSAKSLKAGAIFTAKGTGSESQAKGRRAVMAAVAERLKKGGKEKLMKNFEEYDTLSEQLEAAIKNNDVDKQNELRAKLDQNEKERMGLTGGLGYTDEQLGAQGMSRVAGVSSMLSEEAARYNNSQEGEDNDIDITSLESEIAAASGKSPEVALFEQQAAVAQANRTMFDDWNDSLSMKKSKYPEAWNGGASIADAARVIGKCYKGDGVFNVSGI